LSPFLSSRKEKEKEELSFLTSRKEKKKEKPPFCASRKEKEKEVLSFCASRKEKEKEALSSLASRKSPQSRAEQFAGYFFRVHDCLLQLGRGLFFLAKRVPSFLLLIEEKKAKEDQGGFGRQRSLAGYMQLGRGPFVAFEVPG